MEAVTAHFEEFYRYYLVGAIVVIPVLLLTRKYSLPLILFTIESIIYAGLMHFAVGTIVRVTRWFRENSSMRALREDGKPVDAPEWTTPWIEFWNRDLYDPGWIFYMEIVFFVLVLVAVLRYRPMKVQRKRSRKFDDSGGRLDDKKRGRRGNSGGYRYSSGNNRGRR
jgi:hypothetical protein